MPNRRKVLIGLGTSVAVAGCSDTSEPEPEPEEEEETEEESEPEPEEEESEPEPEPALFEVVNYGFPETAEIGEEINLEVTVENTGGRMGSTSVPMYFRTPDSSWEEIGEISITNVDSGETITKELGSITPSYINRYEYRLGSSSKTAVIQTVSAKIPWGEEYKTPAGYRIRVDEPERQSTYEYEDFQGNIVEKEPDSGGQWAFINVWVKNETGSTKFSPLANEFALLYDSSQADGDTYLIDEPINKGESFDGGELQPGVERSGWIAYQIPGGSLGNDDLTVAWSQTTVSGDIAANWQEE